MAQKSSRFLKWLEFTLEIFPLTSRNARLMIFSTSKFICFNPFVRLDFWCHLFVHFSRFGRIRDIDLKTPIRPPAFAFVVFDDIRDADDAIRSRDGYQFDGFRLRVEHAKGDRGRRM